MGPPTGPTLGPTQAAQGASVVAAAMQLPAPSFVSASLHFEPVGVRPSPLPHARSSHTPDTSYGFVTN